MSGEHVDLAVSTSAVLTLLSDESAPIDGLRALGLSGVGWRTQARGDRVDGSAVAAKTNTWKLDSPLEESADIADHVESLLTTVEELAPKLSTLGDQLRVVITVYWTPMGDWRLYEFSVHPGLASRAAASNVELTFVWIPEDDPSR